MPFKISVLMICSLGFAEFPLFLFCFSALSNCFFYNFLPYRKSPFVLNSSYSSLENYEDIICFCESFTAKDAFVHLLNSLLFKDIFFLNLLIFTIRLRFFFGLIFEVVFMRFAFVFCFFCFIVTKKTT